MSDLEGELRALSEAVERQAVIEAASVWWQILTMAGRLESHSPAPELRQKIIELIFKNAAHVIAAAEQLPQQDILRTYCDQLSAVAAVLPLAAQLSKGDFAQRCVDVFATRLSSDVLSDLPLQVESYYDLTYMNSCAVAIGTSPWSWWCAILDTAFEATKWRPNASDVRRENAAWLLSAACVSCLDHPGNADAEAHVLRYLDVHLETLFWRPFTKKNRRMLAEVYPKLLARGGSANAGRLVGLAHEVDDAELLSLVMDGGAPCVDAATLAGLMVMRDQRRDFERTLGE